MIQFFLYNVIKIAILLVCAIFIVSYIQNYFPPSHVWRILDERKGILANIVGDTTIERMNLEGEEIDNKIRI
ncbi:MAG: hypothetical protein VB027_06535 [Gordonibacter sp.]|nr:hypothetical protein [Gordonibacter sp.]